MEGVETTHAISRLGHGRAGAYLHTLVLGLQQLEQQ